MTRVWLQCRDRIINQSLVEEHIYLPLWIGGFFLTGIVQQNTSHLWPLLSSRLGDVQIIVQTYLFAESHLSRGECQFLLSHCHCLVTYPFCEGCFEAFQRETMFSNVQAVFLFVVFKEGLGQGKRYLRCSQIGQAVGNRFLDAA